jgi:hypothetical protein
LRPILPAMTSWRPLVAGTLGLFLIILAFLACRLKGGGDPALGHDRATAIEQTTPQPDVGAPLPDAAPPATHRS